ncbi:alpha/beta hydrolase [Microbulbifer agarilyticus]|uniref:alpha/beta hydrolase n=1 Tax=Microbulbifer agarilyticus TaxID=260552 RepID=UPI001C98DD74|nr:alpha/beta hydrolase-fold protein [Microbulbifer agarilyticus]MBY6213045.1 alpha/beta hydrolase [Microbulbifer agarilyticus]
MHNKLTLTALLLATLPAIADVTPTTNSTAEPNVHVMPAIPMRTLQRERSYRVYLPEGYQSSDTRYPVLYMHDGQNLFDKATSYAGEWGVDESLNRLSAQCGLKLIVVGIDNGGEHRMTELNPYNNERFGSGEGNAYVDFLVNELKPLVDRNYRTLSGREHTAVMGSSMGGLISNHAINRYPDVFGMAGIFSPSYWIAPQMFNSTKHNPRLQETRTYLLTGALEGEEMSAGHRKMQALLENNVPAGQWHAELDPQGEHNEAFWREEFPQAASWLFDAQCKSK